MLYLNVKRVLRMRGIENPYKFIIRLGFSPATARKLLKDQVWRIDLEHLERFCLALNCTPNDLLEWQPGDHTDAETQSIAKLKRDTQEDLPKLLSSLPLDQFEQITTVLRELKNKQQ